MNTTMEDQGVTIPNPRLLSAVYFSLLAIIITVVIDCGMYLLGMEQLLPLAKAIILAVVVAAPFGALFGEQIVHSKKPYYLHTFLWAFLMVIVALPFYDLGFVYLLKDHHPELFINTTFSHILSLYLFILAYSFILVALWLAMIAGLAAMYLRGRVVYYVQQSLNKRPEP